MLPITGPFSDTLDYGVGTGSRWWSRSIYRQAKPYDLPLNYSRDDRGVGNESWWGSKTGPIKRASVYDTWSPKRYQDLSSWFVASVQNQARERLMNKLRSDQLLLATLAEAKGSINMIANRLDDARFILNALRPSQWWRLKHTSLYNVERNRVSIVGVGKEFADALLEVYFGIMPIMSDIDAAGETLSKDFAPFSVDASAKRSDTSGVTVLLNTSTDKTTKQEEWWLKTKLGCQAKVTNPNAFLAQSLGLVNPFATAWELVPWSFVVDYFVNVGQFVGALSDEYGVSLTKTYTRNNMWSFAAIDDRVYNGVTHEQKGGRTVGTWYRATRASPGLPAVKLAYRQFSLGKDLSRVKTSAALLLQRLTR